VDIRLFLRQEEEPHEKDNRESDNGNGQGPFGTKNKEARKPLPVFLAADNVIVVEFQIGELVGGKLQGHLKKAKLGEHGEGSEARHGEPVSLLLFGKEKRDQDERKDAGKPAKKLVKLGKNDAVVQILFQTTALFRAKQAIFAPFAALSRLSRAVQYTICNLAYIMIPDTYP
jgi:hypothetical protein